MAVHPGQGIAPSDVHREAARLIRFMANDAPTTAAARLIALCTIGILGFYIAMTELSDQNELAHSISRLVDISREGSLTATYMHGLSFLCAILFLLSHLSDKARLPLLFAVVYAFIWFDDSAQYHERTGKLLTAAFDLQAAFGLRAQDFGELMAWSFVAMLLIPFSLWAWAGRRPGDLGIAVLVISAFAALLVFGLVFDMLHVLASGKLWHLVGLVEDGGEMVAVAFTAVIAIGLVRVGAEFRKACASNNK